MAISGWFMLVFSVGLWVFGSVIWAVLNRESSESIRCNDQGAITGTLAMESKI